VLQKGNEIVAAFFRKKEGISEGMYISTGVYISVPLIESVFKEF